MDENKEKEVVNEEMNENVEPVEKDREVYTELEKFITDNKFTYAIVCKQYDNQNVTSLVANREFKMTPQFKFFIQATVIDVLNSIGKDLINEFSEKGLVIGDSKNFITPEKLTEIIGEHLETLEKEGKIKITPISSETVSSATESK